MQRAVSQHDYSLRQKQKLFLSSFCLWFTTCTHLQLLFSKTKSSPFEAAFCVWHRRKTTVSSHFLAPHFSPLHQFLNYLFKKIILQTVPKTSVLDPIPTKLLYKTLEVLLPTITNILNESLTWGIVPSEFKTAVGIKPLLKKPSLDPNELKNYRPIFNLHFLSKLLEKRVLQQLVSHLSTHNLLSIHQSAYWSKHSTETALLHILNDLLISLGDSKILFVFLLDLSAAFDTVEHPELVSIYLSDIDDQKSPETLFHFRLSTGLCIGPCTQHHLRASSKSTPVRKCSQTTHDSVTLNHLKIIQTWYIHFKVVSKVLKLNNDKTKANSFLVIIFYQPCNTHRQNNSQQYRCWVCWNRPQPYLHLR